MSKRNPMDRVIDDSRISFTFFFYFHFQMEKKKNEDKINNQVSLIWKLGFCPHHSFHFHVNEKNDAKSSKTWPVSVPFSFIKKKKKQTETVKETTTFHQIVCNRFVVVSFLSFSFSYEKERNKLGPPRKIYMKRSLGRVYFPFPSPYFVYQIQNAEGNEGQNLDHSFFRMKLGDFVLSFLVFY